MGTIENKTYKNIFITPHEETKTLQVFMNGKSLCGDIFRLEAEKKSVEDIAIFCNELEQTDFNTLINKIKSITDKTTYISFGPQKDYTGYVSTYKEQYMHFPDNIFIRNTFVEIDENKNNLIKKKSI